MENCEINPNSPLTVLERILVSALLAFAGIAMFACIGCKTYYENAGLRVRAGSINAPIEVSEPTSSTNVRFLFFLDGVDLYVAKGYGVRLDYEAVDCGNWLMSATTQRVSVAVSPTNAVMNAESSSD